MLTFRERYYTLEKKYNLKPTKSHPLQKKEVESIVKVNKTNSKSLKSTGLVRKDNFIDPLDPLAVVQRKESNVYVDVNDGLNMEPWSSKRLSILTTFTTSEKLSIVSSFLLSKPTDQVRVIVKNSTITDKVKSRLEQLDQFDEEIRETSNLSVQQFTDKLNELQKALKTSWSDGQRVKTLQIVIQITKMLSEANVAQFFPSKFVLVTDLVDNFGTLVFDRLKTKSVYTQRNSKTSIALPDNFTENQVPEIAKETAKNWFYKVASIRELIARLYVEATLVPCYRFFDSSSIGSTLVRLMKMARGIGDPLLGAYARAYVARIGITMEPYRKDYLQLAFDDIVLELNQRIKTSDETLASNNNNNNLPYLRLYMPAVDWILQCLSSGMTHSQLEELLTKIESAGYNPLLIHAALCSLDSQFIDKKALYFANIISNIVSNNNITSAYPMYILYRQLGIVVSMSRKNKVPVDNPINQSEAMELFKLVWKSIVTLQEPRHFIECADSWADFVACNFQYLQITRFLNQIMKHVTQRRHQQVAGTLVTPKNGDVDTNTGVPPTFVITDNTDFTGDYFYSQLQSILNKLLSNNCDFEKLFNSEEFIQYLALFDRDHLIIDVRQSILNNFLNHPSSQIINDHVVVQACIRMLKEMYDSLNSLSVSDNRRIVTTLCLTLLNRIRFEDRHVEQELELLTQYRASFGSLEPVIINVIERVNALAQRVRSLRPLHQHNFSSSSFVRACMAFSYITSASVGSSAIAIKLYISTAQTALINECLGQAEASIKEAIHLLSKLDSSPIISSSSGPVPEMLSKQSTVNTTSGTSSVSITANQVADIAASIASTLLMCPDIVSIVMDNPLDSEQDTLNSSSNDNSSQTLYLLKGLINAINLCPLLRTDNQVPTNKSQIKAELYIKILLLLAALSQSEYIYRAGYTDANDRIYGGSEQLIQTISDLFGNVVNKIRVLNVPKAEQHLQKILPRLLSFTDESNQFDSLTHTWLAELINQA